MQGAARVVDRAFLVAGASASSAVTDPQPVVVQGAMPLEVDKLASRLDHVGRDGRGLDLLARHARRPSGRRVEDAEGRRQRRGRDGTRGRALPPRRDPQPGHCGRPRPGLHLYDIVLGTQRRELGAFKSPYRRAGAGSDPLGWFPLALTASEGSAGNDPACADGGALRGRRGAPRRGAPRGAAYKRGRVVEGVIGSSDSWNSELDLIASYRSRFGTSVEEMETAPAAQVAGLMKRSVPRHPRRVEQRHERRRVRSEGCRSLRGLRRTGRKGVPADASALRPRKREENPFLQDKVDTLYSSRAFGDRVTPPSSAFLFLSRTALRPDRDREPCESRCWQAACPCVGLPTRSLARRTPSLPRCPGLRGEPDPPGEKDAVMRLRANALAAPAALR